MRPQVKPKWGNAPCIVFPRHERGLCAYWANKATAKQCSHDHFGNAVYVAVVPWYASSSFYLVMHDRSSDQLLGKQPLLVGDGDVLWFFKNPRMRWNVVLGAGAIRIVAEFVMCNPKVSQPIIAANEHLAHWAPHSQPARVFAHIPRASSYVRAVYIPTVSGATNHVTFPRPLWARHPWDPNVP